MKENTTERTSSGLRETLFTELDNFLNGKVDAEHARAVSKLSGGIIATISKDLQAAELIYKIRRVDNKEFTINDLGLNLMLGNNSNAPGKKPEDEEKQRNDAFKVG